MTASGIFDNEASSVDLKVYDDLRALGWSRESKTLLYQPKYDLSPEEQTDFPGSKYSKAEIITDLTKKAMEAGVEYDHLLDPDTRERVELDATK